MSVFQKFFGCCEKPEEQKEIYNNDQEIKTRTNSKGSPNLGTGDNSILNQSKASSNNKKAYSFIISKQNESNLKSESIIENSISAGGQLHLEDNFFPVNNNMSGAHDRHISEIKTINKKLENFCKNEKYITYVDAFDGLTNSDEMFYEGYTKDGLHPNDLGYAKITEILMKYMYE